eukprot:jgi/Ulvmu1/2261/UM013_0108.1
MVTTYNNAWGALMPSTSGQHGWTWGIQHTQTHTQIQGPVHTWRGVSTAGASPQAYRCPRQQQALQRQPELYRTTAMTEQCNLSQGHHPCSWRQAAEPLFGFSVGISHMTKSSLRSLRPRHQPQCPGVRTQPSNVHTDPEFTVSTTFEAHLSCVVDAYKSSVRATLHWSHRALLLQWTQHCSTWVACCV